MAKKKKSAKLDKRLSLPNDKPVKIDMPFEGALKVALNTPIKSSKIIKKH